MSTILSNAERFFDACETGGGWGACSQYCAPDATFACQSKALADVETLEAYCEWMKNLLTTLPDGRYELKFMAEDEARSCVSAYAVFYGTHSGPGGPVEPTGRATASDYVYAMEFDGDRIRHMTKIWNDGAALAELGWA